MFWGTIKCFVAFGPDVSGCAPSPCIIVKTGVRFALGLRMMLKRCPTGFKAGLQTRTHSLMDNLCNASPGYWQGGQFFNATKLD